MGFKENIKEDFPIIRASLVFSLFIYLITRLMFDIASIEVSAPHVLFLMSYIFSFTAAFTMLIIYFILYPIIHYTIKDMNLGMKITFKSKKIINRVTDFSLLILVLFFIVSFIMFLKTLTYYLIY